MNQTLSLVGLFLPMFIDFAVQKITDDKLKFIVAFLICALVGGLLWLAGGKNGGIEGVSLSILSVYALCEASFKLFYKNSELRKNLL